MRTYYRIVDIVHSGRKGIRGEQVTDAKYDGLIGCRATLDITEIERFKPVKIYLLDYNPWWVTSEVLGLFVSNDKVEIETVNTIYRLEVWKSKKEQEKKEGD